MKCITCDAAEAVTHGQCEKCFRNHIQVTTSGSVDVTICPKCGAYKIGNNWAKGHMEKSLSRKIEEHLVTNDTNVTLSIPKESIQLRRLSGSIDFSVDIVAGDVTVSGKEMSVGSKILLNSCLTCNKISGSYYESIIQLRTLTSEHTDIVDRVLDNISGMLNAMNEDDTDSFVSKIVPVKEGIDIYLGKKNDGVKVSKYIHDHYFSDATTTKKLAGRREGEDFYRYTFLVRLFNLEPGTVMWSKERSFILEKIHSNTLTVIEPRTERRYDIRQNDFNLGSYTYSDEAAPTRRFIVLSTRDDESTVMDQENFQVITVKGRFEGEIRAFDYDGRVIVSTA